MNISSFLVTFKIVINHIISLFECFWGRGCWWQSGAEVQCDRWRYCLVGQSLRLNFLSSFPSAVIRQPVFSNIRQRKLWYFELVNLWYALPTQCVTSIRFSLAVMCESTSYRFFMFSSSSSQLKSSFLIRAFKVEAYLPSTGFHISVAPGSPNQAKPGSAFTASRKSESTCAERLSKKRMNFPVPLLTKGSNVLSAHSK